METRNRNRELWPCLDYLFIFFYHSSLNFHHLSLITQYSSLKISQFPQPHPFGTCFQFLITQNFLLFVGPIAWLLTHNPLITLSLSMSFLSLGSFFLRVVSYIFFYHEETVSQRHSSSVTTNHLRPLVLPSRHHTNLNGKLQIARWDEFLGQMGRVSELPSDSRNHWCFRGQVVLEQERCH